MKHYPKILILFCICTLLFSSCKTPNHEMDQNIILFRNKDGKPLSVAEQDKIIEDANRVLGKSGKDALKIEKRCNCDSSLVLLKGADIHKLKISDGGEVASTPTPRPTGVSGDGDSTLRINTSGVLVIPWIVGENSLNYKTFFPNDPQPTNEGQKPPIFSGRLSDEKAPASFIIGIIDSGLDLGRSPNDISKRVWKNPRTDTSGFRNDTVGWNFVDDNNDPKDDNGHGTRMAWLIDEQINSQDGVHYMILKTHNEKGEGLLFDNLCALSYARKNEVKIINASWGFYNNTPSFILKYFLKEMADANIVVVAAAGNKDNAEDEKAQAERGIADTDLRNLDKNKFWPASHSDSSNVITVTTLTSLENKSLGVCPNQNGSANFVDIGVTNADLQCNISDMLGGSMPISGSSYAAPVVTGKLANYLGDSWSGSNKGKLFRELNSKSGGKLPIKAPSPIPIRDDKYVPRLP